MAKPQPWFQRYIVIDYSSAETPVERLREKIPTIVGIDHGFSFPIQYFEHSRDVSDPRGGIRRVVLSKARYWSEK